MAVQPQWPRGSAQESVDGVADLLARHRVGGQGAVQHEPFNERATTVRSVCAQAAPAPAWTRWSPRRSKLRAQAVSGSWPAFVTVISTVNTFPALYAAFAGPPGVSPVPRA